MKKEYLALMALIFLIGVYFGILYGEAKSRYAVVPSGNVAICWVIDSHTGHLYWRTFDRTYDLGTVNSGVCQERKLDIKNALVSTPAKQGREIDLGPAPIILPKNWAQN